MKSLSSEAEGHLSIRLRLALQAVPLLVLWCLCSAASAMAADLESVRVFDIKPQRLESALIEFSRQADLQVTGATDIIADAESNGVTGKLISRVALTALLKGTTLAYDAVGDHTVRITRERGQAGASVKHERGSDGSMSPVSIAEVIVTAQKRAESIVKVPVAISAFTSTDLENSGARQLSDFLASAPGVSIVDNGTGAQEISIRGISSTFGDAPIGFYLDELPFSFIGNTAVPDVRTYDLDRVEVLRGPQGTLYGDGSLGGTVRILTKNPSLSDLQASADAGYFNTDDGDDSYATKGMINIPIKQGIAAMRIVASKEDFGGWTDDARTGAEDRNDRDVENYRAKLRIAPLEKLDIVLAAWRTREAANDSARSLNDRTTSLPATVSSMEYDLYSATARYEFEAFDLVSATSLMDFQAGDFTVRSPGSSSRFNQGQDVLAEELRLTSRGEGSLRWTGGLFYRSIERDLQGQVGPVVFEQFSDAESYAIFGEATQEFLEGRLAATIGLRYFKDDRSRDDGVDPAIIALVQTIDPDFAGQVESSFETVNPKLNVAFHLTEDWMLYANVAKGFRSGQIQPIVSLVTAALQGREIPIGIDEESLWSYEIGTKAQLAGGRVMLEGAAYYNDWNDLQLAIIVDPVTNLGALTNGGSAGVTGLEVNGSFRPIDRMTLRLGASYIDARYREDVAGSNVRDGDRISAVPKFSASASAEYRWPWSPRMDGFVHASTQYTSERVDVVNQAVPSEDTTEVALLVGVESESWAMYLLGNNLTDEDGAVSPRLPGSMGHASRLRPRTYGLNLRYRFN